MKPIVFRSLAHVQHTPTAPRLVVDWAKLNVQVMTGPGILWARSPAFPQVISAPNEAELLIRVGKALALAHPDVRDRWRAMSGTLEPLPFRDTIPDSDATAFDRVAS